jgi:hypothetical protein
MDQPTIEFLIAIGGTLLYAWAFWALYVMIMGLYRAHLSGKMSKISYALGSPFLVVGLIMDVVANVACNVIFLDIQREWLVTTRLQRYNDSPEKYGKKAVRAKWICANLLDLFDPYGNHCSKVITK